MKKTILNEIHKALGARMVDFAGYEMPLHYGSQLEEHHTVRNAAGLFDVSHMGAVEVSGPDASQALSRLLSNNPARIGPGQAQYTLLLNEEGGVIDDLILYQLATDRFLLVLNAANKHQDLAWINEHTDDFDVEFELQANSAILALQGPAVREILAAGLPADRISKLAAMNRFDVIQDGDSVWARTGYTGEDGFEIILPNDAALDLWHKLINSGARPIGLGARDTLRLEAGMSLHGQDMDARVTPLDCGLSWAVSFRGGRSFIGREALERVRTNGCRYKQVGVRLKEKGVLRSQQKVFAGTQQAGWITSGAFSPSLSGSIGLARIGIEYEQPFEVEIRQRRLGLEVVELPFVVASSARKTN